MYLSGYRPKPVKEKIFMLNRIERRINVWEEVGQGFHLERGKLLRSTCRHNLSTYTLEP